jgi:hypothetical protein
MDSLPTDKDYKAMCHKMSDILLPNEKVLSKIEGIVSFGIRISKQDWTKVKMYFMFSNKLGHEEQAEIIQRVLVLPGMTVDNIEFDVEPKRQGKHIAFENERIRADKPRK